ncbi:PREDICTED: serine/arginine repetitive matrix protein 1-like, partial [Chinchilla lanigera]|uniref:serine/arginine repetitive matrix protein 1-like n=1 Tax=Chinchilla lanigera TaxID=34839 RepID=UPI0006960709
MLGRIVQRTAPERGRERHRSRGCGSRRCGDPSFGRGPLGQRAEGTEGRWELISSGARPSSRREEPRRCHQNREVAGGVCRSTVPSLARSVSRPAAASPGPGGPAVPASAAKGTSYAWRPTHKHATHRQHHSPAATRLRLPAPPGVRTPQLQALQRAPRRWRRLYSRGGRRRRHIRIQGGVWTEPKPAGWGRAETFDLTVRVRSRSPGLQEKKACCELLKQTCKNNHKENIKRRQVGRKGGKRLKEKETLKERKRKEEGQDCSSGSAQAAGPGARGSGPRRDCGPPGPRVRLGPGGRGPEQGRPGDCGLGGRPRIPTTGAGQRREPAPPRPPHSRPKSWPRETQSSPQRIDAPPPALLGLRLQLRRRRRPRVTPMSSSPPAPSPPPVSEPASPCRQRSPAGSSSPRPAGWARPAPRRPQSSK